MLAKRSAVRSRPICTLIVVAAIGASTCAARADDGIFGFFQQAFGGGSSQALPQPDYADPSSPPLTVRANRRKRRPSGAPRAPRLTAAELKGITIYTDKTLARGDAVMTPRGIRIFNGSASWPYTQDDFVALSDGKISKTERSELTAMDIASRPEYRHN